MFASFTELKAYFLEVNAQNAWFESLCDGRFAVYELS